MEETKEIKENLSLEEYKKQADEWLLKTYGNITGVKEIQKESPENFREYLKDNLTPVEAAQATLMNL